MKKGKVEKVTLARLGSHYDKHSDKELTSQLMTYQYPNHKIKLVKRTKKAYHFTIEKV